MPHHKKKHLHKTEEHPTSSPEDEASASVKHSLRTMSNIIDDAEELQREDFVAAREVEALRGAFNEAVSHVSTHKYDQEQHACNRTLKKLEKKVKAEGPAATTGDTEETDDTRTWKENIALNVPMSRRCQTFAVTILLFFVGPFLSLGLSMFFTMIPYTAPFMILYWLKIFFVKLRHPLPKWKRFTQSRFFQWYRDYFPCRLVAHKEVRAAVDPKRNYIFCYHPHGVHAFGTVCNFLSDANHAEEELFPGIHFHLQTLSLNFMIPFWREIAISGGLGDASAGCIRKTLAAGPGHCVVLVVGGAEESMFASPHTNDLTLKRRKGFVKIALQTGSPLVPVFGFGENNVYGNYADGHPALQKFMLKLQKKLGFAIPLLKGRGIFNYNFGILPHRRPIVTEVGMPLEVPKIENPTKEDIDHWHAKYVEALLKLYADNKDIYDLCPKRPATVR